jgi:hypothetical protein
VYAGGSPVRSASHFSLARDRYRTIVLTLLAFAAPLARVLEHDLAVACACATIGMRNVNGLKKPASEDL